MISAPTTKATTPTMIQGVDPIAIPTPTATITTMATFHTKMPGWTILIC